MQRHERWIVGLDLGARSHGALVFAAWMRSAASPEGRPQMIGVHVLETWVARHLAVGRDEYVQVARKLAEERIAGVGTALDAVEVIEAERAEDGLQGAASRADALVIGRQAPRGERPLIRLGRVARRLLRRLPAPMFVVPPDLPESALATGSIVLATDLERASAAALELATRLARVHARPLVVAHVGEPRHSDLLDELEPRWLAQREEFRASVEQLFASWAEAHGLGGVRRVLEFGAVPETLADIAARERAAVVVLGSRRLSTVERVFTTSTASAVAGLCPCAVAVAPAER
jgi:nucleotide-binding universal stress UspA family protein